MKFRLVESINEEFAKEKDLKLIPDKDLFGLKLYFISKSKSIKKLSPRLPKSVAGFGMENDVVRRVCLAPSVAQCVKAIGVKDTDYYVYIPKKSLAGHKIYKCSIHEVMDAYVTDEYWCLDDIELVRVAKIHTQNKVVLLGSEKYGWGLKYTIKDVYADDIPYYNILEDFALCNNIKFEKARANEKIAELEFKNEADAKSFVNKIKKVLNESLIDICENVVQYSSFSYKIVQESLEK